MIFSLLSIDLLSKATNWGLLLLMQMLKAHHCKSFKGDIAFLDKWLVNKIDTLLTTIPMYVYICCYVHIHIYAAILKNKTYKFFELVQLFKNQNQYLWVVSLYQCVFMHIMSRDYSLAINELWMFLLCCVFSFV